MMSVSQRPLFLTLVVVILLATLMGGAWLGYQSAGTSETSAVAALGAGTTNNNNHASSTPEGNSLAALLERFRLGDVHALDHLLPHGLTEASGSGGGGLQRQVRSHGLWFPVFDLSRIQSLDDPNLSDVRLSRIPLMITAPNPPPGKIKEPLTHRFTAVGGTPPYLWRMEMGQTKGFTLNAQTGDFSGLSEVELNVPLTIHVSDSAGEQMSAQSTLSIATEEPLAIATLELPPIADSSNYSTILSASGGAKPYTWILSTKSLGWTCDESTGIIKASHLEPGDHELTVTVQDQVTSVQRSYLLRVSNGLEITTGSPLTPAAPGAFYSGAFEATGGTPPYQWSLIDTQLPDDWTFTPEGQISGRPPNLEAVLSLTVQVTDSAGLSFDKSFELSLSRGLLALASDQKVGLAWRYKAMQQTLRAGITGVSLRRNGVEIYRGAGSSYVDHALPIGSTPSYELIAFTTDGRTLPYAAAVATILPFTRQRAEPGVTGDPYADVVSTFNPLSSGGYGVTGLPNNVLGPPNGASTFLPAYLPEHVLSLHASDSGGGRVMLQFTNNLIESGPGADFTIFENVFFVDNDPNKRFMEPAIVEVAIYEDEWFRFPTRVQVAADGSINLKQPTYYTAGFAGVNATTGDDPTNPNRSGGDSFDLSALGQPGLAWIRYIRILATGDAVLRDSLGQKIRHTSENNSLNGRASSGFDLDAVSAVNY
jgi:hypothetical protein